MSDDGTLAIDRNILYWLYFHGDNDKKTKKAIHKTIVEEKANIPKNLFPVYELLSNPNFETEKLTSYDKLLRFSEKVAKSNYSEDGKRIESENAKNMGISTRNPIKSEKNKDKIKMIIDDMFIPVKAVKKTSSNHIKPYLSENGIDILIMKYPEAHELYEDIKTIKEHKEEIEDTKRELTKEHKKIENEKVVKMKHKKDKEIETLKKELLENTKKNTSELENIRNILFQVNQKNYIKKKIQEGIDGISKQDMLKKMEIQLDNNEKELSEAGITKKNYKQIVDQIYLEAPIEKVKHEKIYRKLFSYDSSKLPDGLQKKMNKLLEDDYNNDFKRRKYILPKKKVEWSKSIQKGNINPMILKEIQRK